MQLITFKKMPLERAVGQMIINALVPGGHSATSIIRSIRQAGATYRRQDMLSDIRDIGSRIKYEGNIKRMTGNSVIPRAWMSETELKQPYTYRVFGDADMMDDDTGEVSRVVKSFYTDDLAQKGDMENEFISAFSEDYMTEGETLTNFQIRGVQLNKGY